MGFDRALDGGFDGLVVVVDGFEPCYFRLLQGVEFSWVGRLLNGRRFTVRWASFSILLRAKFGMCFGCLRDDPAFAN